jgi:hypothetical protein
MKKVIPVLILLLAILAGCNTTSIIGSWKEDGSQLLKGDKTAVFCLTPRMASRQGIEDALTAKLPEYGVDAHAGLKMYSPDLKDAGYIEADLIEKGFNSVIIVTLLDATKGERYVPGSTGYAPMPYYGRFGGYWGTAYGTYYEPGYYTTTTSYFVQCNAYKLADNKLVYSAQTQTVDPSSLDQAVYDFSNTIIKDMVKQGVLSK